MCAHVRRRSAAVRAPTPHGAVGGLLEARDDGQQRALAAARRPHEADDLTGLELHVESLQGAHLAPARPPVLPHAP